MTEKENTPNVKLLVSGLSQAGKTRLLRKEFGDEVLVLARDGKKYQFDHPHINLPDFVTVDELIQNIESVVNMYVQKYDKMPEIIFIDTISKILLDIEASCITRIKSFPYGEVNKEITKLLAFIESMTASCDIVLMSHAMYNTDEDAYQLVNAGGSWGKKGGVISEVNNSVFLEIKGSKVTVWQQNPSKLARTTMDDVELRVPYDDYSLLNHIQKLREQANKTVSSAFVLP